MKVLIQAKRRESTISTRLSRHRVQPVLTNTEHEKEHPGISQLEHPARYGHSLANIPIHPQNTASNLESPQSASRNAHEGHEHSSHPRHSFAHLSLFPPERKNNTGLPSALKAGIERLSGLSMDDVSVHYHSSKPAQVRALAYTQGVDIHLGPGQEKHLPHEMWHVVQQKQGRVQPTLQARGLAVNDDQGLEREADVMGTRAATVNGGLQPITKRLQFSPQPLKVLQAVWEKQSDTDYWRWDVEREGVTWFTDVKANMWYKITNPDQVNKLGGKKAKAYIDHEGEHILYQKWSAFYIYPPRFEPQTQTNEPESKSQQPEVKGEEKIGSSEQIATQASDPISKIKQAELRDSEQLGSSRDRYVFYFDASGNPLKPADKGQAKYFVDTADDAEKEAENYLKFAESGVRVPKVYGYYTKGNRKYPILQWIKKQTTFDKDIIQLGRPKGVIDTIRERMIQDLDTLKNLKNWRTKWGRTLNDVRTLVSKGFTSEDPQFMINDVSGKVFLMDLEPGSKPQLGKQPLKILTELVNFLQECLKIDDETTLRAFLTKGSEIQTPV